MVFTVKKRGGSQSLFPGKLHAMMQYIESENLESVMSWVLNGHGFMIHDPDKLVDILPLFFGLTKYRSFRRQLNMWHFERVVIDGPNKGAFVHPFFVKHNPSLCALMSRHISLQPTMKLTNFTQMSLVNVMTSSSTKTSDDVLFASLEKILSASIDINSSPIIEPTPLTTTATSTPVMESETNLSNNPSNNTFSVDDRRGPSALLDELKIDDVMISPVDIECIFAEDEHKAQNQTNAITTNNCDIPLSENSFSQDSHDDLLSSFEGRAFYFVDDGCAC